MLSHADYRRDRAGVLRTRLASLPALHRGIRAATGGVKVIKKEKRAIPATTREVIVERTCDLCHKKARDPQSGEWGTSSYDVEDVTVEYRTGSSYPEGGGGTEYSIDMCPDCFENRLIPWLESQGAIVTEQEWDH
jgi:hypothetical protein